MAISVPITSQDSKYCKSISYKMTVLNKFHKMEFVSVKGIIPEKISGQEGSFR
jgi:hypothetical protein